ncbi:hypothetical protein LJB82_03620 [Desulfovibrio sp. OttesenSCG-928-M16]|nr:hypothetical protein [Desulfovibrio sp. OttesenSCG-928-M16]
MPSRHIFALKTARTLAALVFACLLFNAAPSSGTPAESAVPLPPQGKVFRIAYLEAGPYWSYDVLFSKIKQNLADLGWGDALSFPEELHYSLGWAEERKGTYEPRVRDIFARNNFDLLLSFGTEASQTVVKVNPGTVPIVTVSITNPLAANIVPSAMDSGAPNLTAALNTSTGAAMFTVFHHILQFKTLGILYNDSESGKLYSYLDDAKEVGREIGFTVLEHSELSYDETLDECLRGIADLYSRGAEAIFISNLECVDLQSVNPAPFYDFLEQRNIPTLAADDREQVRHFATLGMMPFDNDEMALFQARQIISILSGTRPGELSMILPFNYRLLINLEAAQRIGLEFPLSMLMSTDEVFLKQLRLQNQPKQ